MSHVNQVTHLDKIRPTDLRDGENRRYFDDLERFARQVYDNLSGIHRVREYTVANLPAASDFDPLNGGAALIYVSDETGGAVLAFSDGTNWRRVTDRVIVA
jgi:hypothetical protein